MVFDGTKIKSFAPAKCRRCSGGRIVKIFAAICMAAVCLSAVSCSRNTPADGLDALTEDQAEQGQITIGYVDTMDLVCGFMTGAHDPKIAGISLDVTGDASTALPLETTKAERDRLLALLEDMPFTFVRQNEDNILHTYGGLGYSVLFTLKSGDTFSMSAEKDRMTFVCKERNRDYKWEYVTYYMIPDDPADAQTFLDAVKQIWQERYDIPTGETRTAAELLGEEILSARQIILRFDPDHDNDPDEIRLYVNTTEHPDLREALTGLVLETTESPADADWQEHGSFEISFHIGDEDYRYGTHILYHRFTLRKDRVGGICPDGSVSYRLADAEPGDTAFAGWLEDWIRTNRDADGVKIARWEE